MQPISLPRVIDIRVTGSCILDCQFCFGPKHQLGHIDLDLALTTIKRFTKYGVEGIVITGGEPTLIPELPFILKSAKEHDLKVVLSTNGLLLRDSIHEIAPYIDWIGLPLDGDSPESHSKMRGVSNEHFNEVLGLVDLIRQNYPYLRIKIGTVVCAINKEHIWVLPDVLSAEYKPDVWKLYQVVYSSYGKDNMESLELTDQEFTGIANRIEPLAHNKGIKTVFYRRAERSGKYLFLEPTGDALVVSGNDEIVIGNFFRDFDGVIAAWHEFVNTERLYSNFINTYPN